MTNTNIPTTKNTNNDPNVAPTATVSAKERGNELSSVLEKQEQQQQQLRRESNASTSSAFSSSCVAMANMGLHSLATSSSAATPRLFKSTMKLSEPKTGTTEGDQTHNRCRSYTSTSSSSYSKDCKEQKKSATDWHPKSTQHIVTPNQRKKDSTKPHQSQLVGLSNIHMKKSTEITHPTPPAFSPWTLSCRSLPPLSRHLQKALMLSSSSEEKETRKKKTSNCGSLKFPLNDECTSLKFSPSGRLLIGGFADGTVRLFDLTAHFKPSNQRTKGTAKNGDTSPTTSTTTTTTGSSSILVDSKDNQLYGAVAGQIHAKGVHTSLLMTVDIAEDCRWCFAGVLRGSMELLALDLTELEREFDNLDNTNDDNDHTHQGGQLVSNGYKGSCKNLLDCVPVYRCADAKLRGFGACTRLQYSESYLLFTGKAIKNIHIWKFTPPAKTAATVDGKYPAPTWVQLYDTQTNGTTIQFLHFRRRHFMDEDTCTTRLEALSKSDGQKLRIWDLSCEDQPSSETISIQSTETSSARGDGNDQGTRRKRPPYLDVPNTEAALSVAGNLCLCGGSDWYNQMSLVSLEEYDTFGEAHRNGSSNKASSSPCFNHTELPLPGTTTTATSTDEGRRRPGRGDLKCLEAAFTTGYDSNQVLLQLSDGSVWNYNPQNQQHPESPDSAPCTEGSVRSFSSSTSLCSTLSHAAFGVLPAGIHRCLGVGRVGGSGLALAASAFYSAAKNKGRLVIVPLERDHLNVEQLKEPVPDRRGFWGFLDHRMTTTTVNSVGTEETSYTTSPETKNCGSSISTSSGCHPFPPTPTMIPVKPHNSNANADSPPKDVELVTPRTSFLPRKTCTPLSSSSPGEPHGILSSAEQHEGAGTSDLEKMHEEPSLSSKQQNVTQTPDQSPIIKESSVKIDCSHDSVPQENDTHAEMASRQPILSPIPQSERQHQAEAPDSVPIPDPQKEAVLLELSRNIEFAEHPEKFHQGKLRMDASDETPTTEPTLAKSLGKRQMSSSFSDCNSVKSSKRPTTTTTTTDDKDVGQISCDSNMLNDVAHPSEYQPQPVKSGTLGLPSPGEHEVSKIMTSLRDECGDRPHDSRKANRVTPTVTKPAKDRPPRRLNSCSHLEETSCGGGGAADQSTFFVTRDTDGAHSSSSSSSRRNNNMMPQIGTSEYNRTELWNPPYVPTGRTSADMEATLIALENRMSYNREWLRRQQQGKHGCHDRPQQPLLPKAMTVRIHQDAAQIRLCQQLWQTVQSLRRDRDCSNNRRNQALSSWYTAAQSLLQWQHLELQGSSSSSYFLDKNRNNSSCSLVLGTNDYSLDCRLHYKLAQSCLQQTPCTSLPAS